MSALINMVGCVLAAISLGACGVICLLRFAKVSNYVAKLSGSVAVVGIILTVCLIVLICYWGYSLNTFGLIHSLTGW